MHKLLRDVAPGLVLLAGVLGLSAMGNQSAVPLRIPLSEIAVDVAGHRGRDVPVPEQERRIAGVSTLMLRAYPSVEKAAFTIYVGYYEAQSQSQSIHSPKNCLPGAGWEPVSVGTAQVRPAGGGDPVTVNRYVLSRNSTRALVYYWYQGRGRVAWNEYRVKWDLLKDKALDGRSEEALVRIVVPVRGTEAEAEAIAVQVAEAIIPQIDGALPLPAGR